jgi:hypothetical protein
VTVAAGLLAGPGAAAVVVADSGQVVGSGNRAVLADSGQVVGSGSRDGGGLIGSGT